MVHEAEEIEFITFYDPGIWRNCEISLILSHSLSFLKFKYCKKHTHHAILNNSGYTSAKKILKKSPPDFVKCIDISIFLHILISYCLTWLEKLSTHCKHTQHQHIAWDIPPEQFWWLVSPCWAACSGWTHYSYEQQFWPQPGLKIFLFLWSRDYLQPEKKIENLLDE